MRHLLAALAATLLTQPLLAATEVGDWRKANERVEQAGGWKAYAREIEADTPGADAHRDHHPDKGGPSSAAPGSKPASEKASAPNQLLTLDRAIQIGIALDPGLKQLLTNTSRAPEDYLRLSDHQRSALSRESQLVAEIQQLYFTAVTAQERLQYQTQVAEAAAIAAELATRMRKVGNLNLLHQAEEQLSSAVREKKLSEARVFASHAREALIRRLQLSADQQNFLLPTRLTDLPQAIPPLSAIDEELLTVGSQSPLVIRMQSEVRQALISRNEAYALAKHYRDTVLPLQRQISEEHLLHYNGMIIGIFDLLKDARHQIETVEAYLNALHAYWQAESALTPRVVAMREQLAQFRRDAWNR
jgi:outer membrane protein TolC